MLRCSCRNAAKGKKATAKSIRLLGDAAKQQILQHFTVQTDSTDRFSACATFNDDAPPKKALALEKKLSAIGNPTDATLYTLARVEQCPSANAATAEQQISSGRQPLIFRTLDRQRYSGLSTPQLLTINSAQQWQEFWNSHFDTVNQPYLPPFPAPEVDFSKQMVLGVFLGAKSCFSVDIENVDLIANKKIVVSYRENAPALGTLCKDSQHAPGHLIAVDRSELPVEFNKLTQARAALPVDFVNGQGPGYVELIDEDFSCPFELQESQTAVPAFCATPESFHDKVVVKDATTWQTVWKGYFGDSRPVPAIDFDTVMVAGLHISGGGCKLEARIESIEQIAAEKILINYSRTALPICAYGDFAKINWFQIPKSDLPVELNLVQAR